MKLTKVLLALVASSVLSFSAFAHCGTCEKKDGKKHECCEKAAKDGKKCEKCEKSCEKKEEKK